ncbi:MAG TPA: dipeptide epimerase [Nitrospiraceae bacterium]|nr:dipeptide epimerase [Nitrospiraceae bacterium]
MNRFIVTQVELWPVDIPLTDPFVVATGSRTVAENAFVRVTLKSGAQGYGEIAPFPEVGGEERDTSLAVASQLAKALLGQPATHYRRIALQFMEMAASHPAARCGLETALLDALCRELNIPLWGFWGGADVRDRDTDITIPITAVKQTLALARGWYDRGFRLFKLKVGADLDEDCRRLQALHRAFPDIAFIVDVNQGFTRQDCLRFVTEAKRIGAKIVLLEQPVIRDDLESLAALRRETNIPIAADESCRSLQDLRNILTANAADVVNIKITKTGVLGAMDIAASARAAGLRLMIGGMVETRIAMGCSFALVLGTGGYNWLDLDTPLLMAVDPVKGGYLYTGPTLHPWLGAGLGLVTEASAPVVTIE